jgi:hypothetical protein
MERNCASAFSLRRVTRARGFLAGRHVSSHPQYKFEGAMNNSNAVLAKFERRVRFFLQRPGSKCVPLSDPGSPGLCS